MKSSVGIIGCGWLGKALALELIKNRHSVVVTTQSTEKKVQLEQQGLTTELLSLPIVKTKTNAKLAVFDQHCLIIAITPQFRQGRVNYPEKIEQLISLAEQGSVKQIVMISSTAIYQGLMGEVDEKAELQLSIEKVSLLNRAEQAALIFKGTVSILRLAGLVGEDRHPGTFLQAGRQIPEPEIPVNLIHQRDVINLLLNVITDDSFVGIYNGVSNTNATKESYYRAAARALNLPEPNFVNQPSFDLNKKLIYNKKIGKKIIGHKIRNKLAYEFHYDDLVAWILT
ncbi:MAG: nucleoside-diphosphate-sugar epimerase [Alteromonadaceae bacterium]|jgi:nucleoside-diphosphate-sugar epimerase